MNKIINMNKIIKFYDFCDNYCEKNEKNETCVNNCKVILKNFFKNVEKYNNESKINSFKIIKKFELNSNK